MKIISSQKLWILCPVLAFLVGLLGLTSLSAQLGLPKNFSDSAYPVKVRLVLSQDKVYPHQTFHAAVEFQVRNPYHIYAPKEFQRNPNLGIPTEILFRFPPKVALKKQWVVKPVFKDVPALGGTLALYEGTVLFFYELQTQGLAPGAYPAEAFLQYAACTNQTCLPPRWKEIHHLTLSVVQEGTPVHERDPDLFHQLDQEGTKYISLSKAAGSSTLSINPSDLPSKKDESGVPVLSTFSSSSSPLSSSTLQRWIDWALGKNRFLALFFIFIAGFLSTFTPCVYPMIPLVLSYFSLHHEQKRSAVLISALCFVFGLAIVYSSLGLSVAWSGKMLGESLSHGWVVYALSLLFILMALSLLGGFEFVVPAWLQPRGGKENKVGYLSSMVMGGVSGVMAAPCIGPILLFLLGFVSVTRDALFGFTALFVFSLGMGVLFIALALFSHALVRLPRSGSWLTVIKYGFGLLMLGLALYLLHSRLDTRLALVFSTVVMGVISLTYLVNVIQFRSVPQLLQQIFRRKVYSGLVVVLSLLFAGAYCEKIQVEKPPGYWLTYEANVRQDAQREKKPLVLDFSADWCLACQELNQTYQAPAIQTELKRFAFAQIDFTDKDRPDVRKLVQKYEQLAHKNQLLPPDSGLGLPFVAIFDEWGHFLPSYSFFGSRSSQELVHLFHSVPSQ